MPFNPISQEEILEVFAEAHGDKEKAFDEVERRIKSGLTRFFTAECEYCSPDKPTKFEAQENRDTWAQRHSMISSDHVVKVREEWF